jgi:hypothetical protein
MKGRKKASMASFQGESKSAAGSAQVIATVLRRVGE